MYSNHLYDALNPTFFVSLLFGTNPIYTQRHNGKRILKSSNLFKLITMAYMLIYTCSLGYGFGNSESKMNITYFGNAISTIGLVLDGIGQILLIYTIYTLSFVIPKRIQNTIEKMAVIDSVYHELGYKTNYKQIFWQQILLFLTGVVAIVCAIAFQFFIAFKYSTLEMSDVIWFIYYFPVIIIFIVECQFSFMVFLIYQRFRVLNQILHDMSTTLDTQTQELRKIQTIMEVHDSLIDAANDINLNYSFQILVCLTVLFIKTVFALFFAYFELFVIGKTITAINWSLWSIIDWNEILLITITCHLAATQARQTGVEIHKLLINTDTNEIRDKLLIFSQQVFHRPVVFTACGLFSIDAQLLFTIIGSGTIYLLIMLQFQEDAHDANCLIANSTVH